MNYKRFDNETDDELIYRICSNKGMENLETWQDVANVLNDLLDSNYGESKYRKYFQSGQKAICCKQNELANYNEELQALEDLREEIKKERIKLQTLNVERNRITRQEARQELFYEQIGKYIQSVEKPKLEFTKLNDKEVKYLQTIADIHYGTEFTIGSNEYNKKIVKDRFCILLSETIEFILDKGLDELTVVLLGDLIQGILRMSDLRSQDSAVIKSCVEVADIIIEYINKLSEYCYVTLYDTVYGNHSQTRYLGTKANENMYEDLGYFIAKYIEMALSKNENVSVKIPKEDDLYLEINNIYNFNIIAFHGHQVKNVNDAIKNLSIQRRKFYDYALCGHLHSDRTITNCEDKLHDCEVLQSSSFCGTDPYAESLFKGAKSACEIYGFDKNYGRVETYKIILN